MATCIDLKNPSKHDNNLFLWRITYLIIYFFILRSVWCWLLAHSLRIVHCSRKWVATSVAVVITSPSDSMHIWVRNTTQALMELLNVKETSNFRWWDIRGEKRCHSTSKKSSYTYTFPATTGSLRPSRASPRPLSLLLSVYAHPASPSTPSCTSLLPSRCSPLRGTLLCVTLSGFVFSYLMSSVFLLLTELSRRLYHSLVTRRGNC